MSDSSSYFRRAKWFDRAARYVISAGGIGVIGCVVLMLVLIVRVALPLFYPADAQQHAAPVAGPSGVIKAIGVDEYLEGGFTLLESGALEFFKFSNSTERIQKTIVPLKEGATIAEVETRGKMSHTLLWSTGDVTLDKVTFGVTYDDAGVRVLVPRVSRLMQVPVEGDKKPLKAAARSGAEGSVAVLQMSATTFTIIKTVVETDLFGNEKTEQVDFGLELEDGLEVGVWGLDGAGEALYVATRQGHLAGWSLSGDSEATRLDVTQVNTPFGAVTALGFVNGDVSVALGHQDGHVTTWSLVRVDPNGSERRLRQIHALGMQSGPVRKILPSFRDKSLLSLLDGGRVQMDHMTSGNHLFDFAADASDVYLSTRNNGLLTINSKGELTVWNLALSHPEASMKAYFGKVWYEGHDHPKYEWQSSAADDDYEPKLSLVPLILGSVKGTFYAMIFAVPLAIFGALYTSQCAHPKIRAIVKPTIEIMAAVPSVIIGFLAALWLAPIVEGRLLGFFMAMLTIPITLLIAIVIWQQLRRNRRLRVIESGYEFAVTIPLVVLGVSLAFFVSPFFETALFGGDLRQWFFDTWELPYDQRNCIVIAFALGFAVIPIIFTISEDAFSNVPHGLTAASLALGGSRWQTIWRVVLPSASPGIFAGVVIGLGRAIGETMIVLMATGNTPVMSMSLFNGMRTLSANIAVEIPEAPVDGTLYRTLFLSAVILFLITSVLNTVAETVRHRLRKKYGQFQ